VSRRRAGFTQARLARKAGISRQALHAVESGRSVPSTSVALGLAGALACGVEDLFSVERRRALQAELAGPPSRRVALARIAGRWVAHPLADAGSLHVAADGLWRSGLRIEPLDPVADLEENVLVSGCDPALGVLAAHVRGISRLVWIDAPSEKALSQLARGHAHLAGAHLFDEASGEHNIPFVRALFRGRSMLVVTLASWDVGLAVPRRDPLRIRRIEDLARRGVRTVVRPRGSGARRLLERLLAREGVSLERVRGPSARGHVEAAHAVAVGGADAAVVPRAVAVAEGLRFVPLARERFDLVLFEEEARDERVERILDALTGLAFRRDVASLPGYDVRDCGRVAARVLA